LAVDLVLLEKTLHAEKALHAAGGDHIDNQCSNYYYSPILKMREIDRSIYEIFGLSGAGKMSNECKTLLLK